MTYFGGKEKARKDFDHYNNLRKKKERLTAMEKKTPGLIICDVDGTLIDSTQAITPAFDRLKQLISENNLHFTLASGRSLDQVKMYLNKLEIRDPVIINNGAGARINGQVLWDEFLPPLCVKEVIHAADRLDMAIFMCYGDSETVYRHNAYIQREIDEFGRYNHFYIPLESEWPQLKLERVMITDPQKPGRIDEVMPYLEPYSDCLQIIRYDDRHVDVMAKGVSKGGAVRRLAEFLQISMDDIMAIGDGDNDLEMIKAAGIGVAVGNAKAALKEAADYVCTESNTAGVIEAVCRFGRKG